MYISKLWHPLLQYPERAPEPFCRKETVNSIVLQLLQLSSDGFCRVNISDCCLHQELANYRAYSLNFYPIESGHTLI